MTSANCVFCKIIAKQIPASVVLETDSTIVIKDLHPQAPIHYLVIPKFHVESMAFLTTQHAPFIVDMGLTVSELSKAIAPEKGFNIVINNGQAAGQSVFHLHWHFLSGKKLHEKGLNLL